MTPILYGIPASPHVLIARAGLEELGVVYKLVTAVPHSQDPEFVRVSPLGKVPALTDGDFSVDDSTAIVSYFDYKLHGNDKKSIFGKDPQSRARIVKFEKYLQIEGFDLASRFFRHFRNGGSIEQLTEIQRNAIKVLDYLESELQDNGHFVVSSYTAADTALVARLMAYHLARQTLDNNKHPKLSSAYEKAIKEARFSKILSDAEAMMGKLADRSAESTP